MIIKHDKSYMHDHDLIDRGYATEDLHSLRFYYEYTKAEEELNQKAATTLSRDDWNEHCIAAAILRSNAMSPVIEALSNVFSIYQYCLEDEVPYSSNWELFFWCNHMRQSGRESEKDLSYFTLTFNGRMTPDQRLEICNRALKYLSDNFSGYDYLKVVVQYDTNIFMDKVAKDAEAAIPGLVGKNVHYAGMDGKVVQTELGVFFVKKYARTRGYKLNNDNILRMSWKLELA